MPIQERYTISHDKEHTNVFHYAPKNPVPRGEPIFVPDSFNLGEILSFAGTVTMRALEAASCIGLPRETGKK